jgi:hypothetical protein
MQGTLAIHRYNRVTILDGIQQNKENFIHRPNTEHHLEIKEICTRVIGDNIFGPHDDEGLDQMVHMHSI